MAQDILELATEDLSKALERAEDDETRYYIWEAAQRIIVAEWRHNN
jgi:hypothetical protein